MCLQTRILVEGGARLVGGEMWYTCVCTALIPFWYNSVYVPAKVHSTAKMLAEKNATTYKCQDIYY